MSQKLPAKFLLLKIANRCNLNCSYCYWFKDKSVYEKSKIIRPEVLLAFYDKLHKHIVKYKLTEFVISLHGGEPMLAGKNVVKHILSSLLIVSESTNCKIKFHIQTNGLLIDDEWLDIFFKYEVKIGISIDGPKASHDLYRKDLRGRPTFDKTVEIINALKTKNIKFGILAVCDPNSNPEEICEFFVDNLGIKSFDILIPDANHENLSVPYIKEYYIKLIKIWYEKYSHIGVEIRVVKNILRGALGKKSNMQSIGLSPIDTCMIKPDGEIEPLDTLHSIGYNSTKTGLNILEDSIDDIWKDPFWNEVYESSQSLNSKCNSCKHLYSCGGGHIASRWSNKRRFDNPSVYCEQLFDIFEFTNNFLISKLYESVSNSRAV